MSGMATEFQQKVWDAVDAIPEGKVTTYGHIAKAAGRPNTARYISRIVGQHPDAKNVPWHRIVYANGTIWCPEEHEVERKKRYRKEGIALKGNKIVNFNDVLYTF